MKKEVIKYGKFVTGKTTIKGIAKEAETNVNKFYRDGKTFIKEIESAEVRGKNGERYYLYCNIRECDEKEFRYAAGSPFIELNNKVLWFENNALETVKKAIEKYQNDRETDRNRRATFRVAKWEKYGITVYYEYSAPEKMLFNVYVEANGVEFEIVRNICAEAIFAMVKELSGDENAIPKYTDIENDPFYQSALKYDDNRLIDRLISLYGKN